MAKINSQLQQDLELLLNNVRNNFIQEDLRSRVDKLPNIGGKTNYKDNVSNVIEQMNVFARYHDLSVDINNFNHNLFFGVADIVYKSQDPDLIQQIMKKTFVSSEAEKEEMQYKVKLFQSAGSNNGNNSGK